MSEKCRICGDKDVESTALCNNCWEVEHRLGMMSLKTVTYFAGRIIDLSNHFNRRKKDESKSTSST